MTRPIVFRRGATISDRVTWACATLRKRTSQKEVPVLALTDTARPPPGAARCEGPDGGSHRVFRWFSSSSDRKNLLYEVRHKTRGIVDRGSRRSSGAWILCGNRVLATCRPARSTVRQSNCAGTVRDQLEEHLRNKLDDIRG